MFNGKYKAITLAQTADYLDGKYAYPSSGEVIDTRTRKTITFLTDENNNAVGSEKMIEVFMANNKATSIADQFGVGRVVK